MEMMQGYDQAQAMGIGEYETLEAGGYICKILKAEERLSKSNKRMLVIYFDIIEGEHTDYYKRRYDEAVKRNTDPNREVKWQGVYRQMLEGENAVGYLKGLMTSIEESNANYKWDWNENNLKNLKFGAVFGEEEYEKMNGDIAKITKIKNIKSITSIKEGNFRIPEPVLLERKENPFASNASSVETDDDLPF